MAQVILAGVGGALGGPFGRILGGAAGRAIDQGLVAALEPPRRRGPRLETLTLQGTAEGAPLACVLGRARTTGQMIWAARFLESRHTAQGGKGGPRTVEYGYSLSFAVVLCEGPIDGIGRIWADGRPMDLTGVTMRLHRGDESQTPDPLIEAVEGAAPAYRGAAYVVFEDLPLGPYGNRPPQLAFEVFRRPRGQQLRLEDRLEGVCLIPGAGEFVLATTPVFRREGLTRTTCENVHGGDGRTDLVASLDQLQAQLPNLKRVSLVVGWFGDDLRAGACTIRPGVERTLKPTEPVVWSVAGLTRAEAHTISQVDGAPAYGGTPSDDCVRQAVAELKARGLAVTLYPFVFMDVPVGNELPDPWGGSEQAAYPWRGRLKGEDGAGAVADVAAVFGTTDGWGLRRMALHYAALAAETGADGLLIGSEMRGLTETRDAAGDFPAVARLRALATECRAVAGPDVALGYAADWSEYAGPREGGAAVFHLDPLWADPAIDFVGIDWYPPLGDWRGEGGGRDGEAFPGPDDPAYLATQVAGGEGHDWFYASDADRTGQVRTPIADAAHGEDWVFRVKALAGWWSNLHHDRPGGVRSVVPTAWIPGMKPVRLMEFGCAAVDRGGNGPNLFRDPKSAESALPPYSTGARDDRMQRRALEAVLGHFADPGRNPVSPVYGGPMLEAADAWCWDARRWPAFPGRGDIWADAGAWRTGHWLNGRLGGETADLIAAVLIRGGLEADGFRIGAIDGDIRGYVIDRPMRTRDALEPLLAGLGLIAAERNGRVEIVGAETPGRRLELEALALPDEQAAIRSERRLEPRPGVARVRYIDGDEDYQTGSATLRSDGDGGGVDLDLPAVCSAAVARTAAMRALEAMDGDRLVLSPGPLDLLALEPGDVVSIEGRDGDWRVIRLDRDETPSATLEPLSAVVAGEDEGGPQAAGGASMGGSPFLRMLDLPPLGVSEDDGRPIAVVALDPWRPMQVAAGVDGLAARPRALATRPATVGVLGEDVGPGPRHRWDDHTVLTIRIEGTPPQNRAEAAVLGGANVMALEGDAGWEVIQFRNAALQPDGSWRLTGLLRGQQGTQAVGAGAGALVVMLDETITRAESPPDERGLPLIWRAGPAGAPPGGPGVSEVTFAPTGLHDRPWSPCHMKLAATPDGERALSWIPRSRRGGDRWDGETVASDPLRFRIRVLDGDLERRAFEVEGCTATLSAEALALDFPDGPGGSAALGVAQWGAGFGWGLETRARLG